MLKKINISTNIILVIIFIIAFIVFIISAIGEFFQKKGVIDTSNINKYIINENVIDETGNTIKAANLVKDYNTFYSLQDASENFIQYVIDNKYSQTYNVISDEMRKKYSRKEYEDNIKKIYNERFSIDSVNKNTSGQDVEINSFNNSNNLLRVYKISDTEYICQTKDINSNTLDMGIRLLNNNSYEVFYIQF